VEQLASSSQNSIQSVADESPGPINVVRCYLNRACDCAQLARTAKGRERVSAAVSAFKIDGGQLAAKAPALDEMATQGER
jgi:hypothetical protein